EGNGTFKFTQLMLVIRSHVDQHHIRFIEHFLELFRIEVLSCSYGGVNWKIGVYNFLLHPYMEFVESMCIVMLYFKLGGCKPRITVNVLHILFTIFRQTYNASI